MANLNIVRRGLATGRTKLLPVLLLTAVCTCLLACNRRCLSPDTSVREQPGYFSIIDHNGKTPVDSAIVYWFDGGVRFSDSIRADDYDALRVVYPDTLGGPNKNIRMADSSRPILMFKRLISAASARDVKTFYIEYPHSATDTIDVELERVEEGSKRCRTQYYVLTSVKHNGLTLRADTFDMPHMIAYPIHKY